jgi:hypothetical protein
MTVAAAKQWDVVMPDPVFDTALARWTAEAAFAETQRAVDGWVMLGFDLGRPVDLDRVIELAG